MPQPITANHAIVEFVQGIASMGYLHDDVPTR